MRNPYYEPLPFDEQVPTQQYEMGQFEKIQGAKDRMVQGLAPTEWDESQAINDKVQFSE